MIYVSRRGPSFPVSAEWKAEAIRRMKDLEMTRAELADRVGCTEAALSQLFGPHMEASSLVPKIHRALDWPIPSAAPTWNRDMAEITHLVEQLDEDRREIIRKMAAALLVELEAKRRQ